MKIDWFTFFAQIVNFLVLVWILKRVLYGPILAALEARRQAVEKELADAALSRETVQKEKAALVEERLGYEKNRAEITHQLQEEMEAERARLLETARREIDELSSGWKKQIAGEKATAGKQLAQLSAREVLGTLRRMLQDLSGVELETAVIRSFISRLHDAGHERQEFQQAITTCAGLITVRTAAPLSEALRAEVSVEIQALNAHVNTVACTFVETPNLIAGIELIAGDRRLAWSFAEYLATLEERVEKVLEEQIG